MLLFSTISDFILHLSFSFDMFFCQIKCELLCCVIEVAIYMYLWQNTLCKNRDVVISITAEILV